MTRKLKPEISRYLRKQLAEGNFIEVAASQARGEDGWELVGDCHSRDIEFQKSMRLQLSDVFTPVVLNPARNLRKVVQVPRPQGVLAFDERNGEIEPIPVTAARDAAKRLAENQRRDVLVLERLNRGGTSVEELQEAVGSTEEILASLRRLRSRKKAGSGVETIDGLMEFDPVKIRSSVIRSTSVERSIVEFTGVNVRAKAGVEVFLSIHAEEAEADSQVARVERVQLDTTNNARVLKVLEACRFLDVQAEVNLSWHIKVGTGRKVNTLLSFRDEEALLCRLGPLASYLP